MSARHGFAVLVLIFLACGKADDPEKIAKTARSWRATLAVVAQSPASPVYRKQIAEAAEKELSKLPASNEDVKQALETARKMK